MLYYGLIAVSYILVLVSENFMNIGQVIETEFRNGKYSDNCHRKSGLYKLLLLISTLFSLLSLWTMKLFCGSRKHIAEFYYFWNQHIESGRKLLKENSQLILVNKMQL